jgi:DNA-directed RNA polymerase subunit N (RpoN/RPB10)
MIDYYNNFKMIVPVRCFTCGKVVADKWRAYTRMVDEDKTLTDEERGKILDTLGIKRICCRTVMLTTVDMMFVL